MKCTNEACVDGRVPRDPSDPLARYGHGICTVCGGAGTVTDPNVARGLGNVGLGASKVWPSQAPRKGSLAAEKATICHCRGGTADCTGACCCYGLRVGAKVADLVEMHRRVVDATVEATAVQAAFLRARPTSSAREVSAKLEEIRDRARRDLTASAAASDRCRPRFNADVNVNFAGGPSIREVERSAHERHVERLREVLGDHAAREIERMRRSTP